MLDTLPPRTATGNAIPGYPIVTATETQDGALVNLFLEKATDYDNAQSIYLNVIDRFRQADRNVEIAASGSMFDDYEATVISIGNSVVTVERFVIPSL